MKKHQISLVGGEIFPVYYGVKKYKPDVLHLIITKETSKHYKKLEKMLNPEILVMPHNCMPYNIQETKKIIESITADPNNHYTFNLTGGTKTMAFAAYERIKELKGAEAFYFTQRDKMVNLESYDEEPHGIRLSMNEMIELTGNQIKDKKTPQNITENDILLARAIMDFILNYPNVYQSLRKTIDKQYKTNSRQNGKKFTIYAPPKNFNFGNNMIFQQEALGNSFTISDAKGTEILVANHIDPLPVLLEGKWWEIIITDAIHNWSPNRELWASTTFSLKSDSRIDKNEVDVLLNLDTVMLFVECKSGDVKASDIDKIHAVRETYGGKMSKSVLVSFFPVPDKEVEKCKELGIEVLAPKNSYEKEKTLERLPKFLDNLLIKQKT